MFLFYYMHSNVCDNYDICFAANKELQFQGIIDVEKEMKRLKDRRTQIEGQIVKLKEKTNQPDYEKRVPEKIVAQNAEKVINNSRITCQK